MKNISIPERSFSLLLVICLTIALLTGCGDKPTPTESGTPTTQGKGSDSKAPTPAKGSDSVVIATATEPIKFFSCGPEGSAQGDFIVLCNIYDTLVTMDETGTIHPCLAESWEVSDDGLSYTFYLRDNVYFHDGTKMTAEDVAFTFDYCAPTTTGITMIINYSHSEVVDDNTVILHLTDPFAAFLNGVAGRASYIISKTYMEEAGAEGYLANPIGTGAYEFVSRVSGDTITLKAFEDYWDGAPPIKNVYIKVMSDATTQMISLESGDIDVVYDANITNVINLDLNRGVAWDVRESVGRITMTMGTNEGFPGFDRNFRKAVQYAVDKQTVVDGAMEGRANIAEIDMNTGYSARPEGYLVVERDVDKAKELLEQSNYSGEPFDLLVQAGTRVERVAQIVQAQLMEIGINCTITATDTATFTSLWIASNYGAMLRSTQSSLADADAITAVFWPGRAFYENNPFPRFDEIVELAAAGRVVSDESERKEIYRQAVDIITEEAYQIPLVFDISVMAYNANLEGVVPHQLFYAYVKNWNWK